LEKNKTPFSFEVPFERKSSQCHARKTADGVKNHTHPISLIKPDIGLHRFITASKLGGKVDELCVSFATGYFYNEDRCCSIVRVNLRY